MRTFRLVKLGTRCWDKATALQGALTHWIMDMDGIVSYLFQPEGLNEDGQPVTKLCLCVGRLQLQDEGDFETVEVPFEILGTQVTDNASGFTGMATQFIRHPNGCFHVEIQPAGMLPKKRKPIHPCEFDLRQCVGEKIPVLTVEERRESVAREPSPEPLLQSRSYDQVPLAGGRDRAHERSVR